MSLSYDHILIRYGELSLKGKNQKTFIKTLAHNIRRQILRDTGDRVEIERLQGRMVLPLHGESPDKYAPSLRRVFGIASFSPVLATELDPEAIIEAAKREAAVLSGSGKRFRVSVKRANKQFPIGSMAFERQVAEALLATYEDLEPDLTDYDVVLRIDIRFDKAYLSISEEAGQGGLPLGTGGRAMVLLSGGIDSPVAAWLMMRRGVVVEAIHFESHPYTSKEAEQKVLDLARRLTDYSDSITVHLVPFTPLQELIGANCHANLRITIMRRMMLRIAEAITERRHAHGIITGDNIGQVASQTIESLAAINQVTTTPVLRPLLTYDKLDIIAIAKAIGTYETSILPYEDCCTVFVPKEPKTKPKVSECVREEAHMPDSAPLIERAIRETRSVVMKSGQEDVVYHFFGEDADGQEHL